MADGAAGGAGEVVSEIGGRMSTKIAWTNETWNPVVGCTPVSAGCQRCYAARFAERGLRPEHRGLTVNGPDGPRWTGEVRCLPERLGRPLRWRKPRRVFVCSMSDLFHKEVRDSNIAQVLSVARMAPQHTFQILTKRAVRLADFGKRFPCLTTLPNVWLGVTAENQKTADERIPLLLQTPAAVRFVSCEPLLGRVNLRLPLDDIREAIAGRNVSRISWVIVGGESGPGSRQCGMDWLRSIVKQCREAGVACFVKQLGTRPVAQWTNRAGYPEQHAYDPRGDYRPQHPGKWDDPCWWPEDLRVQEFPEPVP